MIMGFLTILIMKMDFPKRNFLGLTCGGTYWLAWLSTKPTSALKSFYIGNDRCDLHTILDGLLPMIGNDLIAFLSYVWTTGSEPTPESSELGFNNEVQDIPK